ncbi:unnamed protein product, partial [Prunus brigantina]
MFVPNKTRPIGVDLHGRLFWELKLVFVYQFLYNVPQDNTVVGVMGPRQVKDCLGPGQIKGVSLCFPSCEFSVGDLGPAVVGLDQPLADKRLVDVDLGRAYVDIIILGLCGAVGFS